MWIWIESVKILRHKKTAIFVILDISLYSAKIDEKQWQLKVCTMLHVVDSWGGNYKPELS